ncbi:MAG: bifunctional DNA-formamidopyrimidine glycosylase/DNA-(apurinic or apyrimidinic site) lyase [Candidatus Moranbacteria bacterium]|nr:bifunctional DNA-formamidopyrimidine glycosylase/DNA-(apurinic or apyrimidinic site) lyase [Candidatus Moranbacteria bacterium]
MPELPEVQTIVNDLQILTGDTITGFWTDFGKAIKTKNFEKEVIGRKIKSIQRLSKNIIIELSSNNAIVIHLKMTGQLLLNFKFEILNLKSNPNSKILKQNAAEFHKQYPYFHHIFFLKKHGVLVFSDIRKFATLELISLEKLSEIEKTKGVDPFSKDFTLQTFSKIIAKYKNKNIKSILMNQAAIAGIGNIYASEIPYAAKLNPLRKLSSLNNKEIKLLYFSILKILTKAIKMRGTSISDYRDANGEKGGFQNQLKVYGKAGKKCHKCDTIIAKETVEQRSTFYCPTCQK